MHFAEPGVRVRGLRELGLGGEAAVGYSSVEE